MNSWGGQELSKKLESAEAVAGARFVEARARIWPDSGACWTEIAGAYAMYDGAQSPVTQTFRLGLFETPSDPDFERLEAFFHDRGAQVMHEVSPHAGKELLAVLRKRGYQPIELTDVMYLPLALRQSVSRPVDESVTVRIVGDHERDVWARTAAEGWRELIEFKDFMADLMRVSASREGGLDFLAELDREPIAAGSLAIYDGVALLAGASTIPEWRRRGAQRALLNYRLDYAAKMGCELAMICTEPGSASQRNAQYYGFIVAYTRIKWALSAH
jgi:GNAT superfamily N-acetyltransferase